MTEETEEDELARSLGVGSWWSRLRPLVLIGLVAGLVPFGLSFHVDGLQLIALAGGGAALLFGLAALAWALFRSKTKAFDAGMALVVLALGGFHLLSSGFDLGFPFGASEAAARRELESRDFTDIEFEPGGGPGFSFEARRDGQICTGSIRIEGASMNSFEACRPPGSIEELAEGCEGGSFESCRRAGRQLLDAAEPDYVQATHFMRRSCSLGGVGDCFYVALAHEAGDRGLPIDLEAALRLYERACEAGEVAGCQNAGVMRTEGSSLDAPDYEGALRLFRRGCTGDNSRSCFQLGLAYARARGVERDYGTARGHYARGCELDFAPACTNLGAIYFNGLGVERDVTRAHEAYARSCELPNPDAVGCRMAATIAAEHHEGEARIAARDQLASLCEMEDGDGQACVQLGVLLHEGDGQERDRPRAFRLFERGCELGNGPACRNVAVYLRDGLGGLSREPARAQPFFRRACDQGMTQACAEAR